jgi:hypothetical protein
MKRLITIVFSIICLNAISQTVSPELITASGDYFKSEQMELVWSIGEIMVETYSNTDNFLTQGFHQTNYEVITKVDNISGIDFKISVFPNPTSDLINLQIKGEIKQSMTYKVVDLQGKILLEESNWTTDQQVNISQFSQNMYLLEVSTKDGKKVSVFKIQKTN